MNTYLYFIIAEATYIYLIRSFEVFDSNTSPIHMICILREYNSFESNANIDAKMN